MERTDMVKIGDILRLSEDGALTRKEIALSTGVSTGTVSNVQARAVAAGLSWPLPDGVAAFGPAPSSLSAKADGQDGLAGAGPGGHGTGAGEPEDQAGLSGAARDA